MVSPFVVFHFGFLGDFFTHLDLNLVCGLAEIEDKPELAFTC